MRLDGGAPRAGNFIEYRYVQLSTRVRFYDQSIARAPAPKRIYTREISMMRGEKEERVEEGTGDGGDGGDGGLYSVVSLPVLLRTYPSYPRPPSPPPSIDSPLSDRDSP